MIEEVDARNTTPSDFTIMIQGLPKEANEQSIKEYFENFGL